MGDRMTEADLCEKFIAAATEDGWTAYPEVSGWDIVLVWTGEPKTFSGGKVREDGRWIYVQRVVETGDQLGIEAKLRANCDVLSQAHQRPAGPNFRGVLVPKAARPFHHIARQLQLGVYTLGFCEETANKRGQTFPRNPIVPTIWRVETKKRLWLPPVVPESVQAGLPSPRALTSWRVGALRICAILRLRGWVTSADFKTHGIHSSRWVQGGWIVNSGEKVGRLAKYVIKPWPHRDNGESPEFPDVGWEAEREAIAAQDALAETPAAV